jgi:hypothetical protein
VIAVWTPVARCPPHRPGRALVSAAQNHCFECALTVLLYATAAYSIGAFAARMLPHQARQIELTLSGHFTFSLLVDERYRDISTVHANQSCESWRQEEGSTLTCLYCSGLRFRLSVVSYLIATAIWSYRLRRAADWARRSVANTDAPLAYELATALACRGHLDVSRVTK